MSFLYGLLVLGASVGDAIMELGISSTILASPTTRHGVGKSGNEDDEKANS